MNYEHLIVDDTVYETVLTNKYKRNKKYEKANPKHITAAIPGVIKEIFIKAGAVVIRDESLLILEAMKMQNTVSSPASGKIKSVNVKVDDKVMKNQLLIELE